MSNSSERISTEGVEFRDGEMREEARVLLKTQVSCGHAFVDQRSCISVGYIQFAIRIGNSRSSFCYSRSLGPGSSGQAGGESCGSMPALYGRACRTARGDNTRAEPISHALE
jgi:hypothetical protein